MNTVNVDLNIYAQTVIIIIIQVYVCEINSSDWPLNILKL